MSIMSNEKFELGVTIGRFQVDNLHDGHHRVLKEVNSSCQQMVIIVGVAPVIGTRRNPLKFKSIMKMLLEEYPEAIVVPVPDMPSDIEWSRNIDSIIKSISNTTDVCLYGGRDSFIKQYSGEFLTALVDGIVSETGTEMREMAASKIIDNDCFRKGVIYGIYNQYPKVIPTVDVAIVRDDKVLLGVKKSLQSRMYSFPGGFVDAEDFCFENSAIREMQEETGLKVYNLRFLGTFKINDWRYPGDKECIITTFFIADTNTKTVINNEEFEFLDWVKIEKKNREIIHPNHALLFDRLLDYTGGD